MHLQTWADLSIIIFVALFSLIAVGALVAVAVALMKLQQLVEKLSVKIDPIIDKTTTTLDSVQRITVAVGEKADSILSRGETLTENVSNKVEATVSIIESTVTKPLINLSSLLSGLTKGFSVYTSRTTKSNGQ